MRVRQGSVAVLVAALLAVLAPGIVPVHAGSNGQEIAYSVYCNANWADTTGTNQNGQWEERWFNTPATGDPSCQQATAYEDYGWWWVGNVTIKGYWTYDGNSGGRYWGTNSCNIPKSQQDQDWTWCTVPS